MCAVAVFAFASADLALAQFKTKPPQPGNGWINTPSGIRQSLRNDLTVKVQKEAPKAAISRVVMGQVSVVGHGLDSVMNATSKDRVSIVFSAADRKFGRLILPADVRTGVLVLRGFGPARVIAAGVQQIDFRPAHFVRLAKITSQSIFQLEMLVMRRGTQIVLPIEIQVEADNGTMRLEY